MELCEDIKIPQWLYWLIPRACLAAGLGALLVLDGAAAILAAMTMLYGVVVLAIRQLTQ